LADSNLWYPLLFLLHWLPMDPNKNDSSLKHLKKDADELQAE
jgi:hypothetical protein